MADMPEKACAQAQEALVIALTTGSSRTLTHVREFAHRALKRWPTLPEVHALRDMLGSLEPLRKA
jgi:hypothetical protein